MLSMLSCRSLRKFLIVDGFVLIHAVNAILQITPKILDS